MRDFNAEFFKGNRERLVAVLPDSYILISANSLLQKSADTTYDFRQDSNFWYLTGLDEPDMVLAINTKTGKSSLLVPEQNEYQKEWDGKYSEEELMKLSGVDEIIFKYNLNIILKDIKKLGLKIAYLKPLDEKVEPYGFYSNPARRKLEKDICSSLKIKPEKLHDCRVDIARLRQVKQPEEIAELQKAIDVTGETLSRVKFDLSKFDTEKDLERAITAGFYGNGSDGHGYDPIVANGRNAAIIHYTNNDSKLNAIDLVLLDVGATLGYYSADISRTWSVGGNPAKRQKDVYKAVAELQQKAFEILGPGVKLRDYQKEMEKHAKKTAKKLGFKLEKYPHGFSHFLGLDVHDAGDYQMPLQENCVLTVEPGLYLADEGIGVRIEDIVRITKDGIEIMSKNIPKGL